MMAQRIVYDLTLAVRSPFMFEGLVNDRLGLDSAFIRGQDGEPVIPAAQVKGVLRDALDHLAAATGLITAAEIDALFGSASASEADEQDRPSRGLVHFADLSMDAGFEPSSITRIAIDDVTGVVKTGHLQVVELAAPLGAVSSFRGTLVVHHRDGMDQARIEKAISAAIKLIPAIGAYKSAGFGEVVSSSCGLSLKRKEDLALTKSEGELRRILEVRFDRPILVDTVRQTDNTFFGATIVPGGAFKGALAERLAISGQNPEDPQNALHDALSRLHVSHARPQAVVGEAAIEADLPIPQSLFYVKADGGYLVADAIAAPGPGRGMIFKGISKAPEQVASAKPEVVSDFRRALGLPTFDDKRLARTHIGINEDADGSRLDLADRTFTAADEKLYSTSMVVTRGETWRMTVDASRVESPELALKLLGAFSGEMAGIGRTAAIASFTTAQAEPPVVPGGGVVDILLVSPAVLFDPIENGGATERGLDTLYAEYFETMLEAKLVNFFARPVFAGQYPAVRRRPYGKAYYPFVQTRPGAVFRLSLPTERARQALQDALQFGLPVPALGGKRATWKTCPFVPENGYGQIHLHQPGGGKMSASEKIRWLKADEIAFVEGL